MLNHEHFGIAEDTQVYTSHPRSRFKRRKLQHAKKKNDNDGDDGDNNDNNHTSRAI